MLEAELELEEWAPIPSLPGYDASSLGRVRSWRNGSWSQRVKYRDTPRLRKPWADRDGYLLMVFNLSGKFVCRKVHHLVLETFKGPRPIGLEGRHLDGDPSNNSLCNLEWGTPKENFADKVRHKTDARGERNGAAKLTNAQAGEIRASSEKGVVLAKRYGISQASVCRIRKGHRYDES